jgi:hypothetical protein
MDFSDLPLLSAREPADAEKRTAILATVRSYTLAFFDKYLRGMKPVLLDQPPTSEFVEAIQVRASQVSVPNAMTATIGGNAIQKAKIAVGRITHNEARLGDRFGRRGGRAADRRLGRRAG